MKEALKESIKQITNKYADMLESAIFSILRTNDAKRAHSILDYSGRKHDRMPRTIHHYTLQHRQHPINEAIQEAAVTIQKEYMREVETHTGEHTPIPLYFNHYSTESLVIAQGIRLNVDEWCVQYPGKRIVFVLTSMSSC